MMHPNLVRSKILVQALILFFVILFLAVPVFSSREELDEVRNAIKAKGGRWVANETSVSILPHDHRRGRVGTLKPIPTGMETVLPSSALEAVAGTLPSSLDWRNYGTNSYNYVTSVRDQKSCGSCWAFATTAALESYVLITENLPDEALDLNLSEQVLVSCSDPHRSNCNGGYIDVAANYIHNVGLPPETCFPYTATNNSCGNACASYRTDTDKTYGWHWVTATTPTASVIKAALSTYGPLVTTMDVYSDFFYYIGGVYSYAWGTLEGGHAILIVGYDDAGQYFIVKNSWGTDWGEAGYFKIAYSQLSNAVGFGQYTIAYEAGTQPPPPPLTCTYSLSSATASFRASGGTGRVSITTQSNCSWTAKSNVTWITITNGSSRTGSGRLNYSVSPNTSTVNRTGTMTIAGKTYTVKQSAGRTTRR